MTFGDVVRRVRLHDLVVLETRHPPGLRLPRHHHPRACLNLTLTGWHDEVCSGRTISSDPGTIIFKPALETHHNRYGPATVRCVMVEFGPDFPGFTGEPMDAAWSVRGGPAVAAMREIARELVLEQDGSALIIEGCVWRALGYTRRGRTRVGANRPQWLANVQEYLADRLTARPTLAEVARIAGVHPAHLTRGFRRATGVSIGTWWRQRQVERAVVLLRSTSLSLSQIAAEVGFCDQSHFSRVFRRVIGSTPARVRRDLAPIVPSRR